MCELKNELNIILEQIKQDRFGSKNAPIVSLSKDIVIESKKILVGTLDVKLKKRNGDVELIHQQSLAGVSNVTELHSVVSEALSKVLAAHYNWPK